MSNQISMAAAYPGWERYQELLATAIAPLTPEQLSLRVTPHLRSIMVLAAHIISARVWWFHFVMQEGSPDLKSMVEWDDDGAPVRTASELVDGFNATWAVVRTGLGRWTQEDLTQVFLRPGDPSKSYSRGWIIWHILEHDLHHGGELSVTLGAHDLLAIDL